MHVQLKNAHRDESGQALAFVVGILVVLFAFMVFAIDVGFFFHARRLAQNAADPAALAGAAELPGCGDESPDPLVVANDYAEKNFVLNAFSTGDTFGPFEVRSMEVDGVAFPTVFARVERKQHYLFGQLLGLLETTVPGEAEAACLPSTAVGICPFYIQAPDPDDVPPSATPFGITPGKIYRFKFGSQSGQNGGNRGFLSIYGEGGNDLREAIENGCVGDNPDYTIEEGDLVTDSKPGNMASVWASIAELYEYEGQTVSGVTYDSRAYCNIAFDSSLFTDSSPYDFWVDPTDSPAVVAQKLKDCARDPDLMDNIAGRFWPIAITDDLEGLDCGGRCDFHIDYLAMMYVVCYPPASGANDCDGANPGQASLFGMFIDAVPVMIPRTTGVSNNPLAPKRPLLIK